MAESSLNWEHHVTSMENCFQRAINDTKYSDVTLVSEDYQSFSAHRIILSSCSETFEQILRFSSNSHPLLYLKGFTGAQVKDILQFIYNGKVNVPTKDLNMFVEKAKDLQLLQEPVQSDQVEFNNELNQDNQKNSMENQSITEDEALVENSSKDFNAGSEVESMDQEEIKNLIKKIETEGQKSLERLQSLSVDTLGETESKKPFLKVEVPDTPPVAVNNDVDVEALLAEVNFKNGFHHCPLPQCSYKVKRKECLRTHISSSHDGPKYSCPYSLCSSRRYSSKANLRMHLKNYHICEDCGEKFEENKDLKKHKTSVHPIKFLKNLNGLQHPIMIPNI